jgi:ATP-dependent exoDNAse (exonuclease V) alpha subunit
VLHSYALTVHRSQGSEERHAIALIDMYESYQSRESLYTAASRGQQSVALYGESDKLQAALVTTSRDMRRTKLSQRLIRAAAKRIRAQ